MEIRQPNIPIKAIRLTGFSITTASIWGLNSFIFIDSFLWVYCAVQSSGPPPRTLLDQGRDAVRLKHYSYRTEETYVQWIRRYILFHNKRHPQEMGVAEIEAFLTHLAVQEGVAASTQNQGSRTRDLFLSVLEPL